jgi:soluble lytic murein transglycosylase-like protein
VLKLWCLVLGCALLFACAERSEMRPAQPSSAGELFDPASEWNADNRDAFQTEPWRPRPKRRTARDYDEAWTYSEVTGNAIERSRSVQPIVHAAARTQAVPPDMVNGIIWVESRFQPYAHSSKGACGLMQLMPRTGQEVARAIGMRYEPYDPEFNIHAGTYYFARMVERFNGNVTLALAAYNIGPATVEGWVRVSQPLPGRSRAYVGNVYSAARAFRARSR